MRLFTFLILIFLLSPSAPAHANQERTLGVQDHIISIEPGAAYKEILFEDLGANRANGTLVRLVHQPVHGLVRTMPDRFRYIPAGGMFSLRSDSFTFELDRWGDTSTGTILMTLRTDDFVIASEDFEGGPDEGFGKFQADPVMGNLVIDPRAALEGSYGVRATVLAQGLKAVLELKDDGTGDPHEPGRIKVLGCEFENIIQPIAVLAAGPSQLAFDSPEPNVRAVVRQIPGGTEDDLEIVVQMRDLNDVWTTSQGIAIDHRVHHLDFDWWPSTPGYADGGVILRVDGHAVVVDGIDTTGLDFLNAQVGIMPVDGPVIGDVSADFDALTYFAQGRTDIEPQLMIEGFEGRPSGPWIAAHGHSVTKEKKAILNGDFALQGDLDMGTGYNVLQFIEGKGEIHTRILLDASEIRIGVGEIFRILDFGSDPNAIYGPPHASVRLTSINGVPHIAFHSDNPGGYTSWTPLTGQHWIDVHWMTSKGTGLMANGFVRMWVDGVMIGARLHLDIDQESVNWMRLGVMGVDPLTSGDLYFDDVMVWR